MSEPSLELINRIIRNIAETHDNTEPKNGLWAHLRRDPDAFVEAVKHAFKLDAMRVANAAAKAGPIIDQPMPNASKHRPSWPLVIAELTKMFEAGKQGQQIDARAEEGMQLVLTDMTERDRIGRERYGQPLAAGNGRRHLVDAYQEMLDEVVYLRTWLEENGVDPLGAKQPPTEHQMILCTMYFECIQRIVLTRDLIEFGL